MNTITIESKVCGYRVSGLQEFSYLTLFCDLITIMEQAIKEGFTHYKYISLFGHSDNKENNIQEWIDSYYDQLDE